jgi:hypothetical protein
MMKRSWTYKAGTTGRAAITVALIATACMFFAGEALTDATIIVENNDGPGEGFNDTTPWTPTGGNPATTLGQARLNAFQYAADLWARGINSGVTIRVQAQMDPLYCAATSAVLGQAGTTTIHNNFPGRPLANTWYSQAEANALAGSDLAPGLPDINAAFNSNLNGNPGCLGGIGWYYGLDGTPPGNDIDFVTVVMHELGHGLGFQTFVDLASGAKYSGIDDAYMVNLDHAGASPPDYPSMSNGQRVAASIADPNLRWTGAEVTAAYPNIPLTAGLNGGYVRIYAPNPQEPGSSVSHWSKAVTPNEVMEPAYTGPDHNPSLAYYLLKEIGYTLDEGSTSLADTDTVTVARTAAEWTMRVEVENLGSNNAFEVSAVMTENLPWLTITDPNCAYGDLADGASSFGAPDQYVLDLTSWPGGTFQVDLDVTWEDGVQNQYNDSFTLTLNPPTVSPVAFEQIFAAPNDDAIEIHWTLFADEPFAGFNLYRSRDGQSFEVRLNMDGLIETSLRSYLDADVEPGVTYRYSVAVVMPDGTEKRSPSIEALVGAYSTVLEQNRPNPFNPSTEIGYRLGSDQRVSLRVYDISGKLVRTLVDAPQAAGAYAITWNGRDSDGRPVSSGVYFYKLHAGKFTQTRRMVLLK